MPSDNGVNNWREHAELPDSDALRYFTEMAFRYEWHIQDLWMMLLVMGGLDAGVCCRWCFWWWEDSTRLSIWENVQAMHEIIFIYRYDYYYDKHCDRIFSCVLLTPYRWIFFMPKGGEVWYPLSRMMWMRQACAELWWRSDPLTQERYRCGHYLEDTKIIYKTCWKEILRFLEVMIIDIK